MKPGNYPFIDALRGYAILAVMAVHASQAAPDWVGFGRLLVDQGARGVQLFFVASALTLAMSWHARNDGVLPFYTRRFFRIAPMFWLGIVFFIWLDGFGPRYFAPNGIGAVDIALTALFLHGWHPETFTSVVPGGWSIAVEMTFYLCFPVIAFLVKDMRTAVVAFLSAVMLTLLTLALFWTRHTQIWPGISDELVSVLLSLWFPNQLPVFMVGFIVYYAIRDYRDRISLQMTRAALVVVLAALAALPLMLNKATIFGYGLGVFSYTMYAICFGVFAFCLAGGAGTWLVNMPIRLLGKVSFSAYFIHFAVLHSGFGVHFIRSFYDEGRAGGLMFFLAYFPFLVAVTGVLSAVTYLLIEKRTIALGSRLIRQYQSRASAAVLTKEEA